MRAANHRERKTVESAGDLEDDPFASSAGWSASAPNEQPVRGRGWSVGTGLLLDRHVELPRGWLRTRTRACVEKQDDRGVR
jgi:hypothetical protein